MALPIHALRDGHCEFFSLMYVICLGSPVTLKTRNQANVRDGLLFRIITISNNEQHHTIKSIKINLL